MSRYGDYLIEMTDLIVGVVKKHDFFGVQDEMPAENDGEREYLLFCETERMIMDDPGTLAVFLEGIAPEDPEAGAIIKELKRMNARIKNH